MGSHMKKSIFDDQTSKALKLWTQAAKKKNAKEDSPSGSPATSPKARPNTLGAVPLHRIKSTGRQGLTSVPSRRRNHSDQEIGDVEAEAPASSMVVNSDSGANYTDLLTGSIEHANPSGQDGVAYEEVYPRPSLRLWTQAAKKKNAKEDSPSMSVPSRRRNHSDGEINDVDGEAPASSMVANSDPG